jgi:hypothetical protein
LSTLEALPQSAWSPATQRRWRDGVEVTEQYAGLRHTVAGNDFTFPLAVARHRLKGGKEQS